MHTMTFKTIDEMIEHYRNLLGSDNAYQSWKPSDDSVVDYITRFSLNHTTLKILLSDTNVPSKYDLLIIENISKNLKHVNDKSKDLYKQILDVYKNRKG